MWSRRGVRRRDWARLLIFHLHTSLEHIPRVVGSDVWGRFSASPGFPDISFRLWAWVRSPRSPTFFTYAPEPEAGRVARRTTRRNGISWQSGGNTAPLQEHSVGPASGAASAARFSSLRIPASRLAVVFPFPVDATRPRHDPLRHRNHHDRTHGNDDEQHQRQVQLVQL